MASVLCRIVEQAVVQRSQHVDGLHSLVSRESLAGARSPVLLQLLSNYPDGSLAVLRKALPALLACESHRGLLRLAKESYGACVAARFPEHAAWWVVFGYLVEPGAFQAKLAEHYGSKDLLWVLRELSASKRLPKEHEQTYVDRLKQIILYALPVFPNIDHPSRGWSGDQNPWDASDYVRDVIRGLAASSDKSAGEFLKSLCSHPNVGAYLEYVKHTLSEHVRLQTDLEYRQPSWEEAKKSLIDLVPRNSCELHAVLSDELVSAARQIAGANTDIYKRFWNEDSYGRITSPKPEESARDVLLDMVRSRVMPLGVAVEPEGHMFTDKRADIVAIRSSTKVAVELKRDFHAEVWTAIQGQLDRFYTRDPASDGYGIYGVFWYGSRRPSSMPAAPTTVSRLDTAQDLLKSLECLVPEADRSRIKVVVFDVSGDT